MRKILFRAKHIHVRPENEHLDGRWIEGYLADKNYINSPELEGEFLVDENTVCQYTGLKDKNGKKIFECDIVSAPFLNQFRQYETQKGIVEWLKGVFCFMHINEKYGRHFLGYVSDIEVIGNIYDNPELVENNA